MVPDDDALFGAKPADPTSDSDSVSTCNVAEEDEPRVKGPRLADECSESESDDDSNDDGGDDLVSTYDDVGQKHSLDISLEDFNRALARGYRCNERKNSIIIPVQRIVSIQCQISRVSSYLTPWHAGWWTARRDIVTRELCSCDCENSL